MKVLGLDLSIHATGIADLDGELSTFTPGTNDDRRVLEIRNHLLTLVTGRRPDLVMIEGPFVSPRVSGALILGGVHYVVRVALMANGIPYLCPAPSLVKMYATGKGTAPKLDVIKALMRRTDIDPGDDNQADAAWLRYMGLALAGQPALTLPATHTRALANLRLPTQLRGPT